MSNKKSYWFYLEPFVYISIKKGTLFLFNTLNAEVIEEKSAPVIDIIKKMQTGNNLFVLEMKQDDLRRCPAFSRFISNVREKLMGDLLDQSITPRKPVQMIPHLNVQKDINRMRHRPYKDIGQDIMKYLHEITLYINAACTRDCPSCGSMSKQFLNCNKHDPPLEMAIAQIDKIVASVKGSGLSEINICGGDIFLYSDFARLTARLHGIPVWKSYCVHYLNLPDRQKPLAALQSELTRLHLLVAPPFEEDGLEKALSLVKHFALNAVFDFSVESEEDVACVRKLISRRQIDDYSFNPHFKQAAAGTGSSYSSPGRPKTNLDFFKNNVFLTGEHILGTRHEMTDIFQKQTINLMNFGHLLILSNGDIHANINTKKIGNIKKDTLHEAVYREMSKGEVWLKTREKIKPCQDCHYNLLCPSISNYEYVMKRNNLCHCA